MCNGPVIGPDNKGTPICVGNSVVVVVQFNLFKIGDIVHNVKPFYTPNTIEVNGAWERDGEIIDPSTSKALTIPTVNVEVIASKK